MPTDRAVYIVLDAEQLPREGRACLGMQQLWVCDLGGVVDDTILFAQFQLFFGAELLRDIMQYSGHRGALRILAPAVCETDGLVLAAKDMRYALLGEIRHHLCPQPAQLRPRVIIMAAGYLGIHAVRQQLRADAETQPLADIA